MPTSIDVNAEAAKLTMFRGKTPKTTRAERKGSSTQLGVYRGGLLLLGKSSGISHWETHPEDELIYVLDGSVVLDIVEGDGPASPGLRDRLTELAETRDRLRRQAVRDMVNASGAAAVATQGANPTTQGVVLEKP